MASIRVSSLDKKTHDELACTYAALILHDEKLEISSNLIKKLIEASGNKVEPYWPGLFAKALHGKNVGDLLLGGGGAGAASAEASSSHPVESKKEEAKVEKKEEKAAPPPEEEVDMGGLFDF